MGKGYRRGERTLEISSELFFHMKNVYVSSAHTMKAIELTGWIDEQYQLLLDTPIPSTAGSGRVRVLILVEEDDVDEGQWLQAAAANPAFDFLNDPEEDIYSPSDGAPLNNDEE